MKISDPWKRRAILLIEIALVLIILALITAIWLPALVGPHPNTTGR